jgi:hypothetical protein
MFHGFTEPELFLFSDNKLAHFLSANAEMFHENDGLEAVSRKIGQISPIIQLLGN